MIRVTREQLLNSERGLMTLSSAKLPIATAYRVNKLIKQVGEELQEVEKIRMEILEKYASRDSEGEMITNSKTNFVAIDPEKQEDFNKEIVLLFSEECELSGDPINVDLLDSISMSSQEIASIEPFLSFDN